MLLEKLAVHRCGSIPDSCMNTNTLEKIINYKTPYVFSSERGVELSSEVFCEKGVPSAHKRASWRQQTDILPLGMPYAKYKGTWLKKATTKQDDANILGGYSKLMFDTRGKELAIPSCVATEEYLSYYKAHLLQSGDCFLFDTQREYPIFTMEVGTNYIEGFIKKKGIYLEYHNEPHFHQPMESSSRGHYILAREVPGEPGYFHITAFAIPFGRAVYSEPFAIHCDAHTVGKWRVGYIDAEEFSTALLYNSNDQFTFFLIN